MELSALLTLGALSAGTGAVGDLVLRGRLVAGFMDCQ